MAGISKVNAMFLRLDRKQITDEGEFDSSLSTGVSVLFNKSFVDVTSIVLTPNVASPTTGYAGVYDFTDAPDPTGFTGYVFETVSGNQVAVNCRWIARGV